MVKINNAKHLAALSQRSIFAELCDGSNDETVQATLDRLGVGQKARIELPLRALDNCKETIEMLKGLANDLTAIYLMIIHPLQLNQLFFDQKLKKNLNMQEVINLNDIFF